VNYEALTKRLELGTEATGERNPDSLAGFVKFVEDHGTPISRHGGDPSQPQSSFRELERNYEELDTFGRAYEVGDGPQGCSRETRDCAFEGLCVGEMDMVAAFYQLFLKLLRETVGEEELFRDYYIIMCYAKNPRKWRAAVALYYSIDVENAKTMFLRLPFQGSIRPNSAWEADRADDVLPCMLELRHAFQKGQEVLAERNDLYRRIAVMDKVKAAQSPMSSALALTLQTAENQALGVIAEACREQGAFIEAYVFDGLYIMAESDAQLLDVFNKVAPDVYQSHGIYLALKNAKGSLVASFTPREKRPREAESQELDALIGAGVGAEREGGA
jgi:hypothetical protein